MPVELAADAFDELSSRHYRDSIYANRRILWLAAAAAIVAVFVIIAAVDSSRTSSPRRYANAVKWELNAGHHCDDALGRQSLWFGDVIEYKDMCVSHNISKSQLRGGEDQVLKFMIIGDWGRDGMCCQRDVAAEMAIAASVIQPQFIVSVGDNFYNDGIVSSEDKQVDRSWRDVYLEPFQSLQNLSWKLILGNHDHVGDVQEQINLGKDEPLWHMPATYYFETAAKGDVFLAFIDTTVMFYTPEELRDISNSGAISITYRDDQVAAIKKALADSSARWKIVFGHHPFFASDEHAADEEHNRLQLRSILAPIFKEHNVSVYFGGHAHTLEHHRNDNIDYFISGAGSKISPVQQNFPSALFALDRQGFMVATLSDSRRNLDVQCIDLSGNVVYKASLSHR